MPYPKKETPAERKKSAVRAKAKAKTKAVKAGAKKKMEDKKK